MYTSINYKTKKQLKEAIARGERVTVFQSNRDMYEYTVPSQGTVYLEGPHFPQPHRWYARAMLRDGVVVKVS